MMLTSKCEIGRTVPKPILDLMEHYKEQFDACILESRPSHGYDDESTSFIAKVTAPCSDVCPSHVDIPAYIEGVRDMVFEDSLVATRKTMPLAHVCGRVCPHPCEAACRRGNLDEPVSIMELKRLGADYETDHGLGYLHPMEPKPPRNDGKKVAIVGAGPAGLTAAYYLGLEGIKVDIFEELPVLGGEVAVGVPEYRMPIDKYNRDIELVTSWKRSMSIPITAWMPNDSKSWRESMMRCFWLSEPAFRKKSGRRMNGKRSKVTGGQFRCWTK
jgi:formate dehydrogenase beta subunit